MDPNTPNQGQPSQPGFPPYGSPPPDPTSDRPFSAPAPPPVSAQPASGSGFPAYPPPAQVGAPGPVGSPLPGPGAGQPGQFGPQPGQFGAQPGQFGARPPQKKGVSGVVIGVVLAVVALLVLCGGIGVAAFLTYRGGHTDAGNISGSTDDRDIEGLIDYRKQSPSALTRDHQTGKVTYPMSPPAGGNHNPDWQNCEGKVYLEPIANERAVHSLEHGAVWVTYSPDLPADQVSALAQKVRGNGYLLMSPFPGLDKPISLQAWGYQVKVSTADDEAIDKFITEYRQAATQEPGATCGNGFTGSDPDLTTN